MSSPMKIIERLSEQLQTLSDEQLSAVAQGQILVWQNDAELICTDAPTAPIMLQAGQIQAADNQALKAALLAQTESLYHDFYQKTPLSPAGFQAQVQDLFDQHSAGAFVATSNKAAAFSLFVELGEVIVEPQGAAKFPYGLCFQQSFLNSSETIEDWLENGEAYAQYLSMNVCRYQC